ncbi:hypothetical protein M758_UG020300 [Ceratodon purpureus]|nr:hypothetical protein M758_UG020300 [Ceratodon purpureus]
MNSDDVAMGMDVEQDSLEPVEKLLPEVTAEEQLRTDVPIVRNTYSGKSAACPPSAEIYYNVSTDEEDFTPKSNEYFGQRQQKHGARIMWDRDTIKRQRSPEYMGERDYRVRRGRQAVSPSDDSDYRRRRSRYNRMSTSPDWRQYSDREQYPYRQEFHCRDTPGRSRDSRLEYGYMDSHHRRYMRSTSPMTPPRQAMSPPSEIQRESSSKRPISGGVGTVITVKEEEKRDARPHGKMFLFTLTLKKDSILRRERREKELEREADGDRRVDAGGKQHYIHVNEDGRIYGLGINAWNDALNKVVRGLDPSFIDIRHQPFYLMEVLMNRMNEDFDYSADVNTSWFRTRVGSALSNYRHEFIKMIQAKEERPPWVKDSVWAKLQELEASDKFRMKSEQMRYANSCRRTKGRIGPLGVVGITERLRQKLGRDPDPEEVQEEMVRDKGYSGRVRSESNGRGTTGASKNREGEIITKSSSSQPGISLRFSGSSSRQNTPV